MRGAHYHYTTHLYGTVPYELTFIFKSVLPKEIHLFMACVTPIYPLLIYLWTHVYIYH